MKKEKYFLISDKIKKHLNSFTNTEKRLAEFVSQNQKEIAFCSIHDLSDKLNIGRASIIRFTQKIGYKGYASFKKEIIEELKNDITPLVKYKTHLHDKDNKNFSINQIAQNEVSNINHTLDNLDSASLNRTLNYIKNANTIYIVGMDISSYLAGITAFLLQRIGFNAFCPGNFGLSAAEQIINITAKDLLITFSFPQYSDETIKIAKFAREQKVKVVAITNSIIAPIIKHSSTQLIVKTDSNNFSNSLSPIIVMIYGIASELVLKDKSKSIKAIDKIISLR